jgi:hypothetical protein
MADAELTETCIGTSGFSLIMEPHQEKKLELELTFDFCIHWRPWSYVFCHTATGTLNCNMGFLMEC